MITDHFGPKLAAALVKAQAEMQAVHKDATNPAFRSKFASLDAITEAIRPILAKHGLAIAQGATTPHTDEHGAIKAFVGETMLVHESGEWLMSTTIMPVGKSDAQGVGSALTYFRRYGMSALLGVTADEDDDGNEASKKPAAKRTSEAKPAPVTAPPANAPAFRLLEMPMGRSRGKRLFEMSDADLSSALKWAQDNNKFPEFQDAAALELDFRTNLLPQTVGADGFPDALRDKHDDLPFGNN